MRTRIAITIQIWLPVSAPELSLLANVDVEAAATFVVRDVSEVEDDS